MEREYMEFDVVIVGAGPAGLSAACRLKQKAAEAGSEISVCVVEKGSEVGAHILSGAVFEPRALNELFPDWKELGAPLNTEVKRDDIYVLKDAGSSTKVPDLFVPKTMHNQGNYIISLGNLCRWLAQQAENLGVEVYPGFAAQEALFDENGVVRGIVTGDMGVDREGNPKDGMYTPGMELRGKYTLFAEGCRGHIGKQLFKRFNLDSESDVQHYGIGLKEKGVATEIVVVSVGPTTAQEQLRTALALGADRAILVEAADELNSLAVAKALKAVVDKEQPQLVILGKQAIDSDNNQTGQMLAALTGFAQGTFASKVEVAGDKLNVTREIDGGLQTVALNLPAIVTTDLRLNEPRYASLPNIMKAKKKPLETVTPDALGVSLASTNKTLKVEAPAARSAGIKVKSVAELVEKLKNEAKVI